MPFDTKKISKREKADRERFEKELQVWLNDEVSLGRELREKIGFRWHSRRKIRFAWRKVPQKLLVMALAASGPALALGTAQITSMAQAFVVFLTTLVLLFLSSLLADRGVSRELSLSDTNQFIWVRFGDLLRTVRSEATQSKNKNISIDLTLSLMVGLAAQLTNVSRTQISAALLLYTDNTKTKIRISHRDRASARPINVEVHNVETLLGHHACWHGDHPRVVADFKRFGPRARRGSSQAGPSYRSLFIQPILSGEGEVIRGFVSVDCTVPYAFSGSRADDMVVFIEPLKNHLEAVL